MTRAAWITDPHLNFLPGEEIAAFWESVAAQGPDVVLVGGDIGEAHSVTGYLETAVRVLARPVCVVLGNHDFYRGSIAGVRRAVEALAAQSPHLTYLQAADVIALAPDVALIGVDGWGDGRIGDFENSQVIMTDFLLIDELTGLSKSARLDEMNALGDEAARHVRRVLPEALDSARRVILLTHVPPFKDACWNEGRISDDNFLPFFTCKAVGDALITIMDAHPNHELVVLCGHSHGEGNVLIRPNIRALTGGVEYGAPRVQKLWDVG